MLMSQPSGHLPAALPAGARRTRRGTMPRSFLVKTHSSHRVSNYRQLETQRGRDCPAPQPRPRLALPSQAGGEELPRQPAERGRDPGWVEACERLVHVGGLRLASGRAGGDSLPT